MSSIDYQFGPAAAARERWLHAAVLLFGSVLSGAGAAYPQNTWLQVGPVMLFAAVLPFIGRWPLSSRSTLCVTLFLMLHLFASRWTYSDVPYEQWLHALFNMDAGAFIGTNRNMFDRLVHFAFGLLVVRPIVEWEMRVAGVRQVLAYRLAILFVLAVSAAYEIFEWTLAILMSPEAADKYNGQQGDMFDAQKDMWLALLGGMISLAVLHLRSRSTARSAVQSA